MVILFLSILTYFSFKILWDYKYFFPFVFIFSLIFCFYIYKIKLNKKEIIFSLLFFSFSLSFINILDKNCVLYFSEKKKIMILKGLEENRKWGIENLKEIWNRENDIKENEKELLKIRQKLDFYKNKILEKLKTEKNPEKIKTLKENLEIIKQENFTY